jgi:hypothetical protein
MMSVETFLSDLVMFAKRAEMAGSQHEKKMFHSLLGVLAALEGLGHAYNIQEADLFPRIWRAFKTAALRAKTARIDDYTTDDAREPPEGAMEESMMSAEAFLSDLVMFAKRAEMAGSQHEKKMFHSLLGALAALEGLGHAYNIQEADLFPRIWRAFNTAALRAKTAGIVTATIDDDHTLKQLIDMELESMADDSNTYRNARRYVKVTSEVMRKAKAYDDAVYRVLNEWCDHNMDQLRMGEDLLARAETSEDVVDVMMRLRGGAGYLYYMEAEGSGVSTSDGEWDDLFKSPDAALRALSAHVEHATKSAYRALKDAIFNAAADAMSTAESEGGMSVESLRR